ncbi:hypothetical protein Sjap_016386 [Stephania japonica]|uniref:Methylenetetrahydrofolate reductase n=1 Tax=Stephania japonica TaxID=461633 RepID=A0AAP0IKX2_9MAGN
MKKMKRFKEAKERSAIEFSFDFFAPNTEEGMIDLLKTMRRMLAQNPSFCAIALADAENDADIALYATHEVKNKIGVAAMMHVTASAKASVEKIERALDGLLENGIDRILVFGPEREDGKEGSTTSLNLVRHIRAEYGDCFRIAVIGFPGGHPDVFEGNNVTREGYMSSLVCLKEKVDAGADLIITTIFYDTEIFFKFLNDCQLIGITCPIVPGVAPIYSYKSLNMITNSSKIVLLIFKQLSPVGDLLFPSIVRSMKVKAPPSFLLS